MKTDSTTSRILDVKVKKLELEIAQLRLALSEKEKQKEELEALQTGESLGIDRREREIYVGDTVQILTPSRKGPFKGEKEAIVIGKSSRHERRILIGKIGDSETSTNRESYNLLVIAKENESNVAGNAN